MQLGLFSILLFFTCDSYNVANDPIVTKYSKLHAKNRFLDYLYELMRNIYRVAGEKGYHELFEFGGEYWMLNKNNPGEIVWAFAVMLERIKLLLALVAKVVG